jgi:fluoride exporter
VAGILGAAGITWSRIGLVAAGGAVGSACRYAAAALVQLAIRPATFPLGTAVINVTGCFAIGVLAGLAERGGMLSPGSRLLLMTGFLGGFTTFSAFGLETVQLARNGATTLALANTLGQILAGFLAVLAGLRATGAA